MNEINTQTAISYLLRRAQELDIPLGRTRLIKLLYLLDIEIYRLRKRLFTGLDWVFYKYGPFSFEIDSVLNNSGITEEDIPIGGSKIFRKAIIEFGEREDKLDIEIKAIMQMLLDDWGTANLNELLDYIYYETEPMAQAKFKQRLDFTLIESIMPREERIVISDDLKKRLSDLGKRLCARLEQIKIPDNPLIAFPIDLIGKPSFLEDEMSDLSHLAGKAKIRDG